jgi:signal transduction histidine kinase
MLSFQGCRGPSARQAKVLVGLSTVFIATADFLLPANINVAIFYFLPIVLAGWTRSLKWLCISTTFSIALTFGGIMLAPAPLVNAVTWIDWLNRSILAMSLCVVALAILLRLRGLAMLDRTIADLRRAEVALEKSHALLEERVEERTSALSATNERLQKEINTRIDAENNLQKLSIDLLRAQDDERRRLARELHDGLGQCLAGAKLCLHVLGKSLASADDFGREQYRHCVELIDEGASQVRTLSHLMYPPLLEETGLGSAIPSYVQGFERRCGIHTMLIVPEHLPRFSRGVELTIFRILQESLTNIHRHSGSPSAEVALHVSADAVTLHVKDNGKGLGETSSGVGLRSMKERAKQLKGTLDISSGPQGTKVTVILPIGEDSTMSAVSAVS